MHIVILLVVLKKIFKKTKKYWGSKDEWQKRFLQDPGDETGDKTDKHVVTKTHSSLIWMLEFLFRPVS